MDKRLSVSDLRCERDDVVAGAVLTGVQGDPSGCFESRLT